MPPGDREMRAWAVLFRELRPVAWQHNGVISHEALDRTGVVASVLCAIHCAVAPLLLVIAPTLGGLWVHPLAHLGIAALVLPVAGFALRRGFRLHHLRWVVVVGGGGIALVLLGAVYPYLSGPEVAGGCESGCDQCCPSYVIDPETGEQVLNVPAASVITLMGGIALVVAHIANLRCCGGCRS